MTLKKSALRKSKIYAIFDYRNQDIANLVKGCIINNINIIQLRNKKSNFEDILKKAVLLKKQMKNKALLIINDYPEICMLSDADGLHLGQHDLPLEIARKILGKDKIIGISCHNIKQAIDAQRRGADYIGFGPIFKTSTKKIIRPIGTNRISTLKKKIRIPYFLIGGINPSKSKLLKPLKIKRIAVSKAIRTSDNLRNTIRQLENCLN